MIDPNAGGSLAELAQDRIAEASADGLTVDDYNAIEGEVLAQYQTNITGLDGSVPAELAKFQEQRADFVTANEILVDAGIGSSNIETFSTALEDGLSNSGDSVSELIS